jgi:hypothetical protein
LASRARVRARVAPLLLELRFGLPLALLGLPLLLGVGVRVRLRARVRARIRFRVRVRLRGRVRGHLLKLALLAQLLLPVHALAREHAAVRLLLLLPARLERRRHRRQLGARLAVLGVGATHGAQVVLGLVEL